MKKILFLILPVLMIVCFSACAEEGGKNQSITAENTFASVTATSESETNESETKEPVLSETEIPATEPGEDPPVQTPTDPPAVTPPKEEPAVQTPPAVNFVPSQFSLPGKEPWISYFNFVYTQGETYACVGGKNNGQDCVALVKVGKNNEYLGCVTIFDSEKNESAAPFNIRNGRIYYLQYPLSNDKISSRKESITVCSMNLSGTDKRVEAKFPVSFNNIGWVTKYKDSKYLFFYVHLNGSYDHVYRYDIDTKELVNTGYEIHSGADKFYSIGEKIYVPLYDAIYVYDASFKNQTILLDLKAEGLSVSEMTEDGFVVKKSAPPKTYFLDLAGNLTEL